MSPDVQKKFESYPNNIRPKMEWLRQVTIDVAANETSVGVLEETLKWGEPSYLTTASKSGTTVRIDWKPKYPEQYAIYVSCKTTLIDTFKTLFPELDYEGNRAIILSVHQELPENEIRLCLSMALKYHLHKKSNMIC